MSKQHVFPDRLRHVLPRVIGPRQRGAWERVRRRGKVIRSNQQVKYNQGSVGSSRVRRVCRSCNMGWIKEMEEDCFPLIEQLILGRLTILTPAEQTKIARVATSMAMAGEWLQAEYVSTPQSDRDYYRERLAPPPGWFVFIGKNGSGADQPQLLSDGCCLDEISPKAPKYYASFTMIMGSVLLHILSLDVETIFHPDHYARLLGLAAICPPTDWINFTLMPALDAEEIAGIRAYAGESFRRLTEGK